MKTLAEDQSSKGTEKSLIPSGGRFFQTQLATQSHSQTYGEIVRQLKQSNNARQPEKTAHSERKVRIRTEKHYKPEHSESHWKEKYQRHFKQKSCGFYTPAHVPYTTVGDLNLDLRDLVFESLGKDEAKSTKLKKAEYAFVTTLRRISQADDASSAGKYLCTDSKTETKVTLPMMKHLRNTKGAGGLRDIQKKLEISKCRIVALRAGHSYHDCIAKESTRKVVEIMSDGIKVLPQSVLKQMVSSWKKVGTVKRDSSVEELEGMLAAFTGDQMAKQDKDEEQQRLIDERTCKSFVAKMEALYSLLCYVYHLKTKDLRTKTPLPRDFLKVLKHPVMIDVRGRPIRYLRHTANSFYPNQAADNRSVSEFSQLDSQAAFSGSPHMLVRPSYVNESGSHLFRPAPPTAADSINESKMTAFNRKLRGKVAAPNKIETWDELMDTLSKPAFSHPAGSVDPVQERRAPTRTSFLAHAMNALRHRRTGVLHHLPHHSPHPSHNQENLPIWQQVAQAERMGRDTVKGLLVKKRLKRTASKGANSLLQIMEEGFTTVQAKSAERVERKLKRAETKKRACFKQMFETLAVRNVTPLTLQRVRRVSLEMDEEIKNEDVKASKWYKDLEDEAKTKGLKNETEVAKLLETLYPFGIDDVKAIPYIKAKLCLVVQSMPIFEVCSIGMQEAMQYFLEHILDSANAYNEWLGHRKLKCFEKTEDN